MDFWLREFNGMISILATVILIEEQTENRNVPRLFWEIKQQNTANFSNS